MGFACICNEKYCPIYKAHGRFAHCSCENSALTLDLGLSASAARFRCIFTLAVCEMPVWPLVLKYTILQEFWYNFLAALLRGSNARAWIRVSGTIGRGDIRRLICSWKFFPDYFQDSSACLDQLFGLSCVKWKRSSAWQHRKRLEKKPKQTAKIMKLRKFSKVSNPITSCLINNFFRKIVTVGVNAVTRDLEKDRVCSILLDSTVDPQIIRHVVIMAQSKRIPVLLVPFLREITVRHAGFACAAMALKVCSRKTSYTEKIYS